MKKESPSLQILLSCLLLTLLVAIPFFPVSTFDFIGYDDDSYVLQNPNVITGISIQNIIWAFTSNHSANWHPLTWMSHMIDCTLFGLKAGAHHWMNLNFHIVNTLLLFFILYQMTYSIRKSFFVAAFFAIHPLHVESVAWVAERKDVLSTCMAFFSVLFYVQSVKQEHRISYWLSIFFFSLSLMSKPMTVTLPFLLLLIDFWPLARKDVKKKLVWEKFPFLMLTIISCCITFWAQKSYGAIQSLETLPFLIRIGNAMVAYGWYVEKLIFPVNLAIFYPHTEHHISFLKMLYGTGLIMTGLFCSWRFRLSCPYCLVGFLWYLGTLVPVIGLVQVGPQAYADRYSYMPSIGLFLIFTWGLYDIMNHLKLKSYLKTSIFVSIIIYMLVLCGYQVDKWKNSTTLFKHAVHVVPDNYVALTHLGTIPDLKKAVSIQPNYIPALYNLGTVLMKSGKLDEALTYYLRAIELKADHPDLLNNLGALYFQRKQYELARMYFQKTIILAPYHKNARRNLEFVKKILSK